METERSSETPIDTISTSVTRHILGDGATAGRQSSELAQLCSVVFHRLNIEASTRHGEGQLYVQDHILQGEKSV